MNSSHLVVSKFIRHQPFLFFPLVALCVGIATHETMGQNIVMSIAFVAIAMLGISLFYKKRNITFIVELLLFACIGNLLTQRQAHVFENFYALTKNKTWSARATIENIEPIQHAYYRYLITLNTTEFAEQGCIESWRPITAHVQWYYPSCPPCEVGDTVELSPIVFKEPQKGSYKQYLIKEDIYATLFGNIINITQKTNNANSMSSLLHKTKLSAFATLRHKLSAPGFALVGSLFFGNKTQTKNEINKSKHQFAIWGLSHYLARSGLHLVIFVALLEFLLRFIPLSFFLKQLILLIMSFLYFIFSWSSISFLRALCMFVFYKICILSALRTHLMHVLLLVAMLFLLYNPFQLFFLDFQLSFLLTYALAWISRLNTQPIS